MTRYIETSNPHEPAFKEPWMDEKIRFDDEQKAPVGPGDDEVDPDVADKLLEEREGITEIPSPTCTATLDSGEECGRERPCQYHDD